MIHVIQPSVPLYRVDFFSRLFKEYNAKFRVYASRGNLSGLSGFEKDEPWFVPLGQYRRILPGFWWQKGIPGIPLRRGDLVILCGAPRNLAIPYLMVRCKLSGIPVVWWGHFWSATSSRFGLWIRLFLMQFSSGVILYTREELRKLKKIKSKPKMLDDKPVTFLSNGICIEPIRALRNPYNATSRGYNLFFIGRLDDVQRIAVVLEAIALQRELSVHLHVVGNGLGLETLKEKVRDLGIRDRIWWYGSITEEEKISEVANRCGGFVYGDSVGLSIIQAMAYGLPSIVHSDRRRHGPEIAAFRNGVTGLSYTRGCSLSLKDTIKEFFSSPERLNQMSQSCIEATREQFNTEIMEKQFVNFIEEHFCGNFHRNEYFEKEMV